MANRARPKAGFTCSPKTKEDLHVLAFLTGENKSRLLENGIALQVDRLAPPQRAAFDTARAARKVG